jgi:hypothetical protein
MLKRCSNSSPAPTYVLIPAKFGPPNSSFSTRNTTLPLHLESTTGQCCHGARPQQAGGQFRGRWRVRIAPAASEREARQQGLLVAGIGALQREAGLRRGWTAVSRAHH